MGKEESTPSTPWLLDRGWIQKLCRLALAADEKPSTMAWRLLPETPQYVLHELLREGARIPTWIRKRRSECVAELSQFLDSKSIGTQLGYPVIGPGSATSLVRALLEAPCVYDKALQLVGTFIDGAPANWPLVADFDDPRTRISGSPNRRDALERHLFNSDPEMLPENRLRSPDWWPQLKEEYKLRTSGANIPALDRVADPQTPFDFISFFSAQLHDPSNVKLLKFNIDRPYSEITKAHRSDAYSAERSVNVLSLSLRMMLGLGHDALSRFRGERTSYGPRNPNTVREALNQLSELVQDLKSFILEHGSPSVPEAAPEVGHDWPRDGGWHVNGAWAVVHWKLAMRLEQRVADFAEFIRDCRPVTGREIRDALITDKSLSDVQIKDRIRALPSEFNKSFRKCLSKHKIEHEDSYAVVRVKRAKDAYDSEWTLTRPEEIPEPQF